MAQILWVVTFFGVLIWSAIAPKDFFTWVLEVNPAVIGFVLLIVTRRKFPLTPMVYFLLLVHFIILMVGGHYTYAEVPLFDDLFGSTRNNYDKVGHFAQGFVPAILMREFVIRKQVFTNHFWRNFFIVCFCLGFSAFYELLEWWVALLSGAGAEAFLGTQGYVWDTQSDMGIALLGAIVALALLGRWHNLQLKQLEH